VLQAIIRRVLRSLPATRAVRRSRISLGSNEASNWGIGMAGGGVGGCFLFSCKINFLVEPSTPWICKWSSFIKWRYRDFACAGSIVIYDHFGLYVLHLAGETS
jgi:hypothetical protein